MIQHKEPAMEKKEDAAPDKRVLLIANKWWEADPLCWVLFHEKVR